MSEKNEAFRFIRIGRLASHPSALNSAII